MYGGNTTLPSAMPDYEAAVRKHGFIKPVRGRADDNERPLARRGNGNLTIRMVGESVVVRLYQTDVITYFPDGLIHLEPYASVLTNRVVREILWPRVSPHWADRNYPMPNHITEVGGLYYNTPRFAEVRYGPTGAVLVRGDEPIRVPSLNREKARAVLRESRYDEFRVWLMTTVRLGVDPRRPATRQPPYQSITPMQRCLAEGGDGWRELAERLGRTMSLDATLDGLRRELYEAEGCYQYDTVPHFRSYGEMQAAFSRMRRVG